MTSCLFSFVIPEGNLRLASAVVCFPSRTLRLNFATSAFKAFAFTEARS
jgi:hypothetical protein